MLKIQRIKESCLYVSDLGRSREFYSDRLGLPVIGEVEGRHIFFRAGESVLLCFIADATRNDTRLPPHYASGKQHLAFECDPGDYEDWKKKLEKANIPILQEAGWVGGLKSFYFEDPDRHVLEIAQAGIWE